MEIFVLAVVGTPLNRIEGWMHSQGKHRMLAIWHSLRYVDVAAVVEEMLIHHYCRIGLLGLELPNRYRAACTILPVAGGYISRKGIISR